MSFMNEHTEGDEAAAIACAVDDGFAHWLASAGGSVAITTYQAGKVAMVGWNGRQVHITMRHFPRPMGMAARGRQLAVATQFDLILFTDAALLAGSYLSPDRYDALYLPRTSFHTGHLNLHDMAFGEDGLWVVNTRFCCLSMPSEQFSFEPRWRPHFISQLAPEDRCHLNGLALVDGKPKYVTALGRTDTPRGWVPDKATGGILMDVPSNQIIRDGFCMPHSPRWHRSRLWVLNSGLGEIWIVDPARADHTVVAAMPGYLRGLDFVGEVALVGLSKVREKHLFAGLPVQKRHEQLICGVAAVNTRTGQCLGMLRFTSGAVELYDVAFLPGIFRPAILNHQKPASREAITAPQFAYWIQDRPAESLDATPSEVRCATGTTPSDGRGSSNGAAE